MAAGTMTPAGGAAATQPVIPAGQLTPAQLTAIVEQLTPIQARFRQASTFLQSDLNQASFSLTAPTQTQNGKSTGLAVRLISEWNVTITVANSATTAGTFNVSPWFPWNLIANTNVSINGGAATYSCSGLGALFSMLRIRRASRLLGVQGGFGQALSPALVRYTFGSNLTPTSAAATDRYLGGVKSVSVAASASSNNTFVITFYTVEKLTLDKDSLLGALPVQNQSTSVAVNRQIQSALSGTRNDYSMPFSSAAAGLTFTLTTCTVDTTYEFASVPADSSIYQGIITHAYECIEQPSNTVVSTGAKALNYAPPLNKLLVAAHIFGVDTNGAVIAAFDATNGLGNFFLQYNAGTVTPAMRHAGRDRLDKFLSYGDDPVYIPGWRLWDGEDTSDSLTESDNMGWLNTYVVADPNLYYDVGSSAAVTLTFSALREAVVRGAVTTVG